MRDKKKIRVYLEFPSITKEKKETHTSNYTQQTLPPTNHTRIASPLPPTPSPTQSLPPPLPTLSAVVTRSGDVLRNSLTTSE